MSISLFSLKKSSVGSCLNPQPLFESTTFPIRCNSGVHFTLGEVICEVDAAAAPDKKSSVSHTISVVGEDNSRIAVSLFKTYILFYKVC
jgi:hypothetical protein